MFEQSLTQACCGLETYMQTQIHRQKYQQSTQCLHANG
jgi:hypothetical protein